MIARIFIALPGIAATVIFLGMAGISAQGSGRSMVGWPVGAGLLWGLVSTISAVALHANGRKNVAMALLLLIGPVGFALASAIASIPAR